MWGWGGIRRWVGWWGVGSVVGWVLGGGGCVMVAREVW